MTSTEIGFRSSDQPFSVLLVDANGDSREHTLFLLESFGCQVSLANNNQSALDALQDERRNYQLVIADLLTPDINGFELLTDILSEPSTAEVPVVFMCTQDDPHLVLDCIQRGAKGCFQKPISSEDLEILCKVNDNVEADVQGTRSMSEIHCDYNAEADFTVQPAECQIRAHSVPQEPSDKERTANGAWAKLFERNLHDPVFSATQIKASRSFPQETSTSKLRVVDSSSRLPRLQDESISSYENRNIFAAGTLRTWIELFHTDTLHESKNLSFFWQVLNCVIAERGRSAKEELWSPSQIEISGGQVLRIDWSDSPTDVERSWYCGPASEVLQERRDTFRLGVLLFELCFRIEDARVKDKVMLGLKDLEIPADLIEDHPLHAARVLWLLEYRPPFEAIPNSELFQRRHSITGTSSENEFEPFEHATSSYDSFSQGVQAGTDFEKMILGHSSNNSTLDEFSFGNLQPNVRLNSQLDSDTSFASTFESEPSTSRCTSQTNNSFGNLQPNVHLNSQLDSDTSFASTFKSDPSTSRRTSQTNNDNVSENKFELLGNFLEELCDREWMNTVHIQETSDHLYDDIKEVERQLSELHGNSRKSSLCSGGIGSSRERKRSHFEMDLDAEGRRRSSTSSLAEVQALMSQSELVSGSSESEPSSCTTTMHEDDLEAAQVFSARPPGGVLLGQMPQQQDVNFHHQAGGGTSFHTTAATTAAATRPRLVRSNTGELVPGSCLNPTFERRQTWTSPESPRAKENNARCAADEGGGGDHGGGFDGGDSYPRRRRTCDSDDSLSSEPDLGYPSVISQERIKRAKHIVSEFYDRFEEEYSRMQPVEMKSSSRSSGRQTMSCAADARPRSNRVARCSLPSLLGGVHLSSEPELLGRNISQEQEPSSPRDAEVAMDTVDGSSMNQDNTSQRWMSFKGEAGSGREGSSVRRETYGGASGTMVEKWHCPDSSSSSRARKERLRLLGYKLSSFVKNNTFELVSELRTSSQNTSGLDTICASGFDRDDEFFATVGLNKKVKVFDFNRAVSYKTQVHCPIVEISTRSKLSSVCWSPYVKSHLVTSDHDRAVTLWDAEAQVQVSEWCEHRKRVWAVDVCPVDPQRIASASDDGSVKIWHSLQDRSVLTIQGRANVCCVQYSPVNANIIALGSANNKLLVYDLRKTANPILSLVGHKKTVSYVRFLGGDKLVSASTDNRLNLWELSAGLAEAEGGETEVLHPAMVYTGHVNEKNFVGMSVSNDGYIACGSEDNSVYAYHQSVPWHITSHLFASNAADAYKGSVSKQYVSTLSWQRQGSNLLAVNSTGLMKILTLKPLDRRQTMIASPGVDNIFPQESPTPSQPETDLGNSNDRRHTMNW